MKSLLLLSLTALMALTTPTVLRAASSASTKTDARLGADGPLRQALERARQRWQAFRKETPLTREQQTKIREIVQPHRNEIRAQLSALRDARKQLQDASKDNGDLTAAAEKVGEAARHGALLRARLAREIRPILTPEQRQRVDSALDEFHAETGRLGSLR